MNKDRKETEMLVQQPQEDLVYIYVQALVSKLEKEGLETQELIVQRGIYLLDCALGANLNTKWEPYLYGPFSESVKNIDYEAPKEVSDPIVNERIDRLISLFMKALEQFPQYKKRTGYLWELLGTTDYTMRYAKHEADPRTSEGIKEIAETVHRWKGYIDPQEVEPIVEFLHGNLKYEHQRY